MYWCCQFAVKLFEKFCLFYLFEKSNFLIHVTMMSTGFTLDLQKKILETLIVSPAAVLPCAKMKCTIISSYHKKGGRNFIYPSRTICSVVLDFYTKAWSTYLSASLEVKLPVMYFHACVLDCKIALRPSQRCFLLDTKKRRGCKYVSMFVDVIPSFGLFRLNSSNSFLSLLCHLAIVV